MVRKTEKDFKFQSIPEYEGDSKTSPDIYVYEKIDGGNCSVRKEEGVVKPHSRSRDLTTVPQSAFYFRRFIEWVHTATQFQNMDEETIFCGEWTHSGFGHIKYDDSFMNSFFLLGIYDGKLGRHLNPGEVDEKVKALDLEKSVVRLPVLSEGHIDNTLAESLVSEGSSYYNGPREGIVIHQYGGEKQGLKMWKHFNLDFREVNDLKKGIEKYITRRRLVKAAQNLKSNGKDLTFEKVVSEAVDDIRRDFDLKPRDLQREYMKWKDVFYEDILPLFVDNN